MARDGLASVRAECEQSMHQNPYKAPNGSFSQERWRFLSTHLLVAVPSSVVLVLLGFTVSALNMVSSDAPGFFLLAGLHLVTCGLLGVICLSGRLRWPVRQPLCWLSIILNAALAVRTVLLVFDGTILGPLMIAAPILVAIPAAINVAAAVVKLLRFDQTNT